MGSDIHGGVLRGKGAITTFSAGDPEALVAQMARMASACAPASGEQVDGADAADPSLEDLLRVPTPDQNSVSAGTRE